MKLNNHGWGLVEMLLIVALLLFFLLISIFYVSRLYNGLAKDTNSEKIKNAVNEYLYNKYGTYDAPYDMMLPLETLKDETDLKISDDCKGYVLIKLEDNETVIKDKISCN